MLSVVTIMQMAGNDDNVDGENDNADGDNDNADGDNDNADSDDDCINTYSQQLLHLRRLSNHMSERMPHPLSLA